MTIRSFACLIASLALGVGAQAAVVRSNGKGGGLWSAPTTWDGGRVPVDAAVTILSGDVVDVDAAAGNEIRCDELVIDARGALRVLGTAQTALTFQIRNALKIFGGMIVDLSRSPGGRCEFQWPATAETTPEILFSEGCKVRWKGALSNALPNLAFRVVNPAKPVLFPLGGKVWFECDTAILEGFQVQVAGVDGSGMKFNEAATFRNCHFLRSPVTFNACAKIRFEGNTSQNVTGIGVYFLRCGHARAVSNVVERASQIGIRSVATSDSEYVGNIVRGSGEGASHTGAHDVFSRGERFEGNRTGLMLNSCGRVTVQRAVFADNTSLDVRTAYERPGGPWRFYDCAFPKPAPVSISVEGMGTVELINTPLQTYAKRNAVTFSAYVDVRVTNDAGEPLERVPLRVLAGEKVIATSYTEPTGHTPAPASHRPLVVPWHQFAAGETVAISYQLEVDGTALGYRKQTVPLVVDAGFLRANPNQPTQTVTVKLAPAK